MSLSKGFVSCITDDDGIGIGSLADGAKLRGVGSSVSGERGRPCWYG